MHLRICNCADISDSCSGESSVVTFETELDKAIAGFRKSAVIRAELAMALPAALIPVSALDGLQFSYVGAVELVISFSFAAFLLGCAYAVLYSRDFFG